jgi:lactate permease
MFSSLMRREFVPFAFLLGALLIQKMLLFVFAGVVGELTLATARVSFSPLASPALALLAGAWLTHLLNRSDSPGVGDLLWRVCSRAWRALLSILLFLLTARLLLEAGAVASLGDWLSGLGRNGAVVTVTVLGGLGAYVTGSGVTANALFMPSAAATGQHFDLLTLFAALQHSAAGHAAMASLPVIAVLLAALPQREKGDEAYVLRYGLVLALVWVSMVSASGFVQLSLH